MPLWKVGTHDRDDHLKLERRHCEKDHSWTKSYHVTSVANDVVNQLIFDMLMLHDIFQQRTMFGSRDIVLQIWWLSRISRWCRCSYTFCGRCNHHFAPAVFFKQQPTIKETEHLIMDITVMLSFISPMYIVIVFCCSTQCYLENSYILQIPISMT